LVILIFLNQVLINSTLYYLKIIKKGLDQCDELLHLIFNIYIYILFITVVLLNNFSDNRIDRGIYY